MKGQGVVYMWRKGTVSNGKEKEKKTHRRHEKKGDNPLSWFASERGVLCTCRGGKTSIGTREKKKRKRTCVAAEGQKWGNCVCAMSV